MTFCGNASIRRRLLAAVIALSGAFGAGHAVACGGSYIVQQDDTLSQIADRLYKNVNVWRILHRDNRALVGDDPDTLRAGTTLQLPCIDGSPFGEPARASTGSDTAATTTQGNSLSLDVINLVTAGGFGPFTDRNLNQGGLITDLVRAAMTQAGRGDDVRINWINDRTAHLDPLMRERMMDMAFPSYRPACEDLRRDRLCDEFLFSDPMFETLILLFVDKTRPVPFSQDIDIEGKTLCRPAGFSLEDLDRGERRWISGGKVTLLQPLSVGDCFGMLMAGDVDAVAVNEFAGRAAVRDMGLGDRIDAMQGRALSIETLHVLVHKDHPQAAELLGVINSGLRQLRATGEFQRVIDQHLSQFWTSL